CGELRDTHIGKTVTLNGWVNTYRSYNNQVFVDLRDRYGVTQVVFESEDKGLFQVAEGLRSEFVVSVTGTVAARLPGKENPKLATGKVEVKAQAVRVLNACPTPPFEITEFGNELANEDVRLQYRYLDLRRKTLQETLALRHRVCKVIRDNLDAQGFLEVETPLLGKSTPEGARDYLVPSRLYHGEWYALPQSPQLYKQLLMVAGYDKYFQIARCLRDEDTRADRQPEFTQLDMEMSFVEMDDVFRVVEGLVADIIEKCVGVKVKLPLPRMAYAEAMAKYGSDKPDLRFGMEIVDVTDIAGKSEFGVFKNAVAAGGMVRALNAKGAADKFSNTALKPGGELPKVAETYKAKGLAWMKYEGDKFTGTIEKFFPEPVKQSLKERLGVQAGDLLLFVADKEAVVCDALGALRTHLASALKLYRNWWEEKAEWEAAEEKKAKSEKRAARPFVFRPEHFNLLWVVDFPSFIWDDEEKRWVALHHPFTSPRDEDLQHLESEPARVKAKAYDLVMNGYEVAGGSIRIHSPEVQSRVFQMLGMSEEDARARFGFLLDALKFGAPPHGGIAFGLDRWTMLLAGTTNIRDVIAFPKNAKAR
ncbi:MAG: aspartate--tRNA ligase, partial [Zavarzinella sp.]|nr:aspartate--tRNA ligase [Zavarzinella sp.]